VDNNIHVLLLSRIVQLYSDCSPVHIIQSSTASTDNSYTLIDRWPFCVFLHLVRLHVALH